MRDTTLPQSTAPSEQDLIEIAAESMWHAYRRTPEFRRPWETCAEDDKEVYRNKARAAIAAIRPLLESKADERLAQRDAEIAELRVSNLRLQGAYLMAEYAAINRLGHLMIDPLKGNFKQSLLDELEVDERERLRATLRPDDLPDAEPTEEDQP